MEGVVFEHRLEERCALHAVETDLAEIADIALEHIVQNTRILGREGSAGDKGVGCEVTIADIELRTIGILIIG